MTGIKDLLNTPERLLTDRALSRRAYLKYGLVLGTSGMLSACLDIPSMPAPHQMSASTRFVSAFSVATSKTPSAQHYAAACDEQGRILQQVALPARAHAGVDLPHLANQSLLFGRRPGFYALQIDWLTGEIVREITPNQQRHFYGHGIVNPQGDVLFSTENVYEKGYYASAHSSRTPDAKQGVIVLRDTQNMQVIAEYASGGVGPHECQLLNDGKTLVVANGGIQTHPELPRKKLNLDSMQPNLTYIDVASGKIVAQYQPPHHHLSLRHLSVTAQNKVIVGAQWQNASMHNVPALIYSHTGEDELNALNAEHDTWLSLNGYTASVCVNDATDQVAVTCPRANLVTYWDTQTNNLLKTQRFADSAGLLHLNDGFLLSNGKGQFARQSSTTELTLLKQTKRVKWDNHMHRLS